MYQMYKPTSGCVASNRVGRASPVVPGLSPHPVWSQHFSLGTVVRGCSHVRTAFPQRTPPPELCLLLGMFLAYTSPSVAQKEHFVAFSSETLSVGMSARSVLEQRPPGLSHRGPHSPTAEGYSSLAVPQVCSSCIPTSP